MLRSHLELRLLFDLPSLFNDLAQLCVLAAEHLVLLMQALMFEFTSFEGVLERTVASNTRLLGQFLVLLVKLCTLVLLLGQPRLCQVKLLVDLIELGLILLILGLNVLHLLARVREHDHVVDDLAAEASKLLISLLNLLIQCLVFDLELLVVNQVETFSQLFALLQHFFLVR